MAPAKRPYQQTVRAETTEETRQRVLDALHERLREAPDRPVSVDEVARRAKVARSTVYLAFGSRTGLFDALTDHLLRGEGFDRIVASVRHPDVLEAMRGALAGGVAQYAAHQDVFRVLVAMARLDPEGVGPSIDRAEAQRADGIGRLAGRLHDQGFLRPGLTARDAADLIWVLASFDTFDTLTTARGLSDDEAAATIVRTAEAALLVPPADRPRDARR
ncbi:MAG: TetR/AcrR family transcriptional regulator [Thermoleophilia bacterium]